MKPDVTMWLILAKRVEREVESVASSKEGIPSSQLLNTVDAEVWPLQSADEDLVK